MKILIACEYSGTVRDAFTRTGHDAMSCDLMPTDAPGKHYQGDVRDVIGDGWDLMIAHPPCTDLAVSGARWFPQKRADGRQQAALNFVRFLLDAPIDRIAVENPVSVISSQIRKPDQIIQPWQFGHGEVKATCLWLKNLPELVPTRIVDGREARVHRLPPSQDRWKLRSTTYAGIAAAMALQWGSESTTVDDVRRECDQCERTFATPGGLATHMRAHTSTPIDIVSTNVATQETWTLADAARARDAAEQRVAALVRYEREHGTSGGEIGTALGVSRQAAQQRYGATGPSK